MLPHQPVPVGNTIPIPLTSVAPFLSTGRTSRAFPFACEVSPSLADIAFDAFPMLFPAPMAMSSGMRQMLALVLFASIQSCSQEERIMIRRPIRTWVNVGMPCTLPFTTFDTCVFEHLRIAATSRSVRTSLPAIAWFIDSVPTEYAFGVCPLQREGGGRGNFGHWDRRFFGGLEHGMG